MMFLLQQSQNVLRREAPIDNKLPPRCFQHPVGRNCCLTGLLYLLTLYFKRASLEFPRASKLLPRHKSPSSGEIASFPETLWSEGTLLIIWSRLSDLNIVRVGFTETGVSNLNKLGIFDHCWDVRGTNVTHS
jgi:hypothetical protein